MVKYKMLVVFLLVALIVGCTQLGMPITGSGVDPLYFSEPTVDG